MRLKRKQLNEQIYSILKSDILSGEIAFGEKLVNRELQERFGVSSTPVRDAINRLHGDGMLEEITNTGARVIAFDAQTATEVNEVILCLSWEAALLTLKKKRQTELIPILQQCIRDQVRCIDSAEYFEYDRKFHQAFFDHCENRFLEKIYSQHSVLWELLVLYFYKDQESVREHSITEHQRIVDAYTQENAKEVRRCFEAHFQSAIRPFVKILNGKR